MLLGNDPLRERLATVSRRFRSLVWSFTTVNCVGFIALKEMISNLWVVSYSKKEKRPTHGKVTAGWVVAVLVLVAWLLVVFSLTFLRF